MCGIAGYQGSATIDPKRMDAALELMKRRGPDNRSCKKFSKNGVNTYLLHSRLNIIDLDHRSDQPMQYAGKWITQNGELYNYVEIRRELENEGIRFETKSDTEVLLKALAAWGKSALDKMEGMWAFAFYDESEGSLMLCRDRFGEKPLYILPANDGIYFGSEIKFIATLSGRWPKVNVDHLYRYMVNGYKSLYKTPATFYEGVGELEPGTYLHINGAGDKKTVRYWSPKYEPDESMSYESAVRGARERLLGSVDVRLRSDVPLAFCMSGGVDSNALISIAKRIFGYDVHGFTIVNSDERYDEQELVDISVKDLGIKHTAIPVDTADFLSRLRELVAYHDAPVYTITYYAHWLLMQSVAEHGYRVSVSGTGADEIFTGYYDHYLAYLAAVHEDKELYAKSVADWQKYIKPVVRNPLLQDPEMFVKNSAMRDHIYLDAEKFASRLTGQWHEPFEETQYTKSLLRNRMLNEMFHEAVRVILHEDDLNAMYYSIENRSPFLDRRLFEFCYSIPSRHLIQDGMNKSVLRSAIRGIAPDPIVDNRIKVGFNAPVFSFLDVHDSTVRELLLDDSPVFEHVKKETIEKIINEESLPNSESKFLFYFLNVKMFLEQHNGELG